MFYSFRQTNARFVLNHSSRTLECHISLIIYCMTLYIRVISPVISNLQTPEHAPAYMMAVNVFTALIRIRYLKDTEGVF